MHLVGVDVKGRYVNPKEGSSKRVMVGAEGLEPPTPAL